MNRILFKFFMIFCFSISNVYAVTVIETTDFPPGSSSGPDEPTLGLLDLGVNTVSGSLADTCEIGRGCNVTPDGDSQDSFLIEIDSGLQLDNIFVTTSNIKGPAIFGAVFDLSPNEFLSDSLINEVIHPLDSTTGDLVSLALSAGVYRISMFGGQASQTVPYSLDYSIDFGVTPVPVPTAVWLFGSGLIGLIGTRKKSS